MDEQNKNNSNIKTIHTYASDMAEAIANEQASMVKIALAEQNKKQKEIAVNNFVQAKKINFVFIFIGILLIIGAYFLITFLNKKSNENNVHEVVTKEIPTIIHADKQVILNNDVIGKEETAKIIQEEVKKGDNPDSMKALILKDDSAENFLKQIGSSASGAFVRSLGKFMLGTYTKKQGDTKSHLFLIIETKNYDQAFAGMLTWEKTLFDEMFSIFGIDVNQDRSVLFSKNFEDLLIDNNDARIIKDNTGQAVLYYMFIGKNNLVITDDIDTIKEITKRIRTQSIKPL